jgi:hypothetical protein
MTDQPTLFDQPIEEETRRDSFGIVPTRFAGMSRFELLAQQGIPPIPMDLTIDPTRLSRAQDPDTSRKAGESASRRGPSQRRRVWEALKKLGGATDYEISMEVGILRSSAAKRRQELVDLGHVVETPMRRKTDTGTEAIVWRCSYVSDYSGS